MCIGRGSGATSSTDGKAMQDNDRKLPVNDEAEAVAGKPEPANPDVATQKKVPARDAAVAPRKAETQKPAPEGGKPAPEGGAADPKSPDGKKTANRLREFRIERMMSKAELARKAGLSVLTVARIESGYGCRMDTKRKVLKALGLRLSDRRRVFEDD